MKGRTKIAVIALAFASLEIAATAYAQATPPILSTTYSGEVAKAINDKSYATLDAATESVMKNDKLSFADRFKVLWDAYTQFKGVPEVSSYLIDAIRSLQPRDHLDTLITDFDEGKGDPKARAMLLRAIAMTFVDPYSPGFSGSEHQTGNEKVLAFLKTHTVNPSFNIAREATLAYSRRALPDDAATAVKIAYQEGKIETEHFFRESIIQLPGLKGKSLQDDVVDSLIGANSFRSKEAARMALSRLFAAYVSSEAFTDAINQVNKPKIDAFLMGQEPPFTGAVFEEMMAIEYMSWLEARARLQGVSSPEIPKFMLGQLQSSAGSAEKITAAMLSPWGKGISDFASPAQREALLSTLTSPESAALLTQPNTADYLSIAIQCLSRN